MACLSARVARPCSRVCVCCVAGRCGCQTILTAVFFFSHLFTRCACDPMILTRQGGAARITQDGKTRANLFGINMHERRHTPSSQADTTEKARCLPLSLFHTPTKEEETTAPLLQIQTSYGSWAPSKRARQIVRKAPKRRHESVPRCVATCGSRKRTWTHQNGSLLTRTSPTACEANADKKHQHLLHGLEQVL